MLFVGEKQHIVHFLTMQVILFYYYFFIFLKIKSFSHYRGYVGKTRYCVAMGQFQTVLNKSHGLIFDFRGGKKEELYTESYH